MAKIKKTKAKIKKITKPVEIDTPNSDGSSGSSGSSGSGSSSVQRPNGWTKEVENALIDSKLKCELYNQMTYEMFNTYKLFGQRINLVSGITGLIITCISLINVTNNERYYIAISILSATLGAIVGCCSLLKNTWNIETVQSNALEASDLYSAISTDITLKLAIDRSLRGNVKDYLTKLATKITQAETKATIDPKIKLKYERQGGAFNFTSKGFREYITEIESRSNMGDERILFIGDKSTVTYKTNYEDSKRTVMNMRERFKKERVTKLRSVEKVISAPAAEYDHLHADRIRSYDSGKKLKFIQPIRNESHSQLSQLAVSELYKSKTNSALSEIDISQTHMLKVPKQRPRANTDPDHVIIEVPTIRIAESDI